MPSLDAIIDKITPRLPGKVVTRFAPSPTGPLHLGHVFSALVASMLAEKNGGQMMLRIDDLDKARCEPRYVEAILDDLAFLGISHAPPIRTQSEHFIEYHEALAQLQAMDVVYPCYLTRSEVATILSAPHEDAPPDNPTNTDQSSPSALIDERKDQGIEPAWRLRIEAVRERAKNLVVDDLAHGAIALDPDTIGDVVIARRDIGASYHLSVVVDDAAQGVTLISRGVDLLRSAPIHRLLQELLGLPVPLFYHHGLVVNETGKRLAKRDAARSVKHLRAKGLTAEAIIRMICDHLPSLQ